MDSSAQRWVSAVGDMHASRLCVAIDDDTSGWVVGHEEARSWHTCQVQIKSEELVFTTAQSLLAGIWRKGQ